MLDPVVINADDPAVLVFAGGTQGGPSFDTTNGCIIKNAGAGTVYLGGDATVDATDGFPLATGEQLPLAGLSNGDDVYAFAAAPTQLRILGLV